MDKKDWQMILNTFALLTQVGIVMLANIGVGFYLGYLLDSLLAKEFLFKMMGMFLGVISGFYSDYRLIKKTLGDDGNADR